MPAASVAADGHAATIRRDPARLRPPSTPGNPSYPQFPPSLSLSLPLQACLRARRRRRSIPRPPCPDGPADVPERLPDVDYIDYAERNEPGSLHAAAVFFSFLGSPSSVAVDSGCSAPPRAHCHHPTAPGEPPRLSPLLALLFFPRSCSHRRA